MILLFIRLKCGGRVADSHGQSVPKLQRVPCDNCGSDNGQILFSGSDQLCGLPGIFTYEQCCQCGWIRQNPRLGDTDLQSYYPNNYVAFVGAIEDEKGFWNRWDRRYGLIKRRKGIERFVSVGRILEVGCGTGVFLNEMRRHGWSVYGIEPNTYAANYAYTRFNLEVFRGTLEQFELAHKSFDVIYLSNVLEHLATPAQSLRRMAYALKPGGLLALSIPNLESLDRRLFRESWIGWEIPRHLYLFPRQSLERFFSCMGMRVIARDCPAGSHYAFLLSVQLFLNDRTKLDRITIGKVINVMRQLPVRIVAFPFFRLMDHLRWSAIITYYVRKD